MRRPSGCRLAPLRPLCLHDINTYTEGPGYMRAIECRSSRQNAECYDSSCVVSRTTTVLRYYGTIHQLTATVMPDVCVPIAYTTFSTISQWALSKPLVDPRRPSSTLVYPRRPSSGNTLVFRPRVPPEQRAAHCPSLSTTTLYQLPARGRQLARTPSGCKHCKGAQSSQVCMLTRRRPHPWPAAGTDKTRTMRRI